MRILHPPLAFWRDWLWFSGRVFARCVIVLCVVWATLGWVVLPLVLPPPPCGPVHVFPMPFDADDGLPECLPVPRAHAASAPAAVPGRAR